MKFNDRKKILKNILLFLMSFLLFYFASMPSRIMLQIYDVTDIRFSAVLNPTLSIAFGYPAIIGCTLANSFYNHIVDEFKNIGFDVKIFMDTVAEDDDDLTCGNLLLPNM